MTRSDDKATKPLVLLVDDIPANLHVLAAALKAEYRLKTATSGAIALELAGNEVDPPDLILLDVMMPELSGIDVLRILRSNPLTRGIPVIFVSADTSEESQLDGLKLGADDYLTKPISAPILQVRVRHLLARRRSERELRLAGHVFEHSGEAILITDHENRILEVNPAFCRMTGYSLAEVQGRDPRLLSAGRTPSETYSDMWRALNESGVWQGELWDRHKTGALYPKLITISVVKNEQGKIDYHIASFADISQQKEAEARINYIAHHDVLTGLANRLQLTGLLQQFITAANRDGDELAVIFIDLDRFKHINDTLGHNVGDALLVEVAHRLRDCVRASDVVARLGGDEFVVLLKSQGVGVVAANVAEKIVSTLSHPYQVMGHELHSTPSMGISTFPENGKTIELLMKCADTAMYHAKENGRGQYHFFTEEMNRRTRDLLILENSLYQALENGEFRIVYQPQSDIASGHLVGVEALIRWDHPERGRVPPAQFIPIAEETGLIVPIGEWFFRQVCQHLLEWRAAGLSSMKVAVNLSASQFRQNDLCQRMQAILDEYGIEPQAIELEITESMTVDRPEQAIVVLQQLRDLGVSIAIDDFGTGYSSLAYLRRFPVDKLKVDRSFVTDIPHDANATAITSAVIQMAKSLGLQVVAEGVETLEQRDYLFRQGCALLQGYWYSRPIDAQALVAFSHAHASDPGL